MAAEDAFHPKLKMNPSILRKFFASLLGIALGGAAAGPLHASPYLFQWTGTVSMVTGGPDDPNPTVPGIAIGDTMVATLRYDPLDFGAGIFQSVGYGYDAPAGLEMHFDFSSGGAFTRAVASFGAYDDTHFDQIDWFDANSNVLFQGNDFSGNSFSAIPPPSFVDANALVASLLSDFEPSDGNHLSIGHTDVLFANQHATITSVPEPAAGGAAVAAILGLAAALRFRKSRLPLRSHAAAGEVRQPGDIVSAVYGG